jgi:hypothetical protein
MRRLIKGWSREDHCMLPSQHEQFVAYLRASHVHVFDPAELNEVLLSIYIIIRRAVRDQADTLTLTTNAFIWSREGIPIGHFDTTLSGEWNTSYAQEFKKLLQRDAMIRNHLQRIQTTPEEYVYRILIDPSQEHSAN